MKEITEKQILGWIRPEDLAQETEFCQWDWIRENARWIAMIETGKCDKRRYGDWKKGWKYEMKKRASEEAKKRLIAKFIDQNCMVLSGRIWTSNMKYW